MTADEETRLRRENHDPWRVETDHYVVTTNDSLEEGVALARRLEQLVCHLATSVRRLSDERRRAGAAAGQG